MLFIRYLQLCSLMLLIILGGDMPPRKPRGDLRNFARSFYFAYKLRTLKGKLGIKGR